MLTFGQILVRLVVAAVLAGIIGLEREFKHKPAGLRTNILVSVGSALIMMVSIMAAGYNGDASRIASGVITGVGFLGAGLIIQSRGEVHGLTTAATIWLVSAVGLSVGIGFYSAAFLTTIISLVVLYFFRSDKIMEKFNNHENYDSLEDNVDGSGPDVDRNDYE